MDYSNTQEDNCSNADSGQTGTKTCQMKSPENKPGKLHDLELKDKLAINCDKSDKDNGSKRGEFDDLELQEKSSAGGTDDSTGSNNTEIHVLELQGKEKPDESGVGTSIKGRELYIDTNKILSIIGNDDESGSKGTERLDLELQEKPTTGGSDDNAERKKRELRTIQLRLAAICMVWVFAFTAYSGLQNLKSSLNARVGTYALAGLTGVGFLTCLLAPVLPSLARLVVKEDSTDGLEVHCTDHFDSMPSCSYRFRNSSVCRCHYERCSGYRLLKESEHTQMFDVNYSSLPSETPFLK